MNVDIDKPIQVSTVDFLKAYGYTDKDKIYFRLFHDKDNTQKAYKFEFGLSKINADAGDTLKNYNGKDYGVFFVVNGNGHNDEDVLKGKIARAQFMEIDDLPFNEQLEKIGDFPLEPSIIVKTRKSLHTYWLLKDGDIKRFRTIQTQLVTYFDADPKNVNESRVMRLPNFTHNKQEPIEVQVVKFDPALTYTQDEIASLLPEVKPQTTPAERRQTPTGENIEAYIANAGGRHNAIMSIGGKIRNALPADMLDAAIRGINSSFAEPLDDRELNKYINDLQRYQAEDDATEQRIQENYIDVFTETTKPEETLEDYLAESAADLADLDALIEYTGNTPAISTGFLELDEVIDDGLRNGFYIIGAISSLGKTTFTIQICDNLAKQGQDVLFYSLEMSKAEIQAKSISRESLLISLERYQNSNAAKTSIGIMNGRRIKQYRDNDAETVQAAKDMYKSYAGHIHIIEGVGNITVRRIAQDVERHIRLTGRTPIVFIDYLQLLAPYETGRNLSDKQITDKNVLELKRLSRRLPIIAISSFNRESYTEPVNLSSFKESGSVEYTSDILIGLQYEGMDYDLSEKEKDRKDRIALLLRMQKANARNGKGQDIQVKILKNRHGLTGDIALKFYPKFNFYKGVKDNNPFPENTQQEPISYDHDIEKAPWNKG